MRLKLPIWNFWAALGPQCAEMIQNGTKTNPLEHLGGWARSGPQRLGPKRSKTLPKLSETKHLGFKRDPWPGSANLALRKGWLEDASEREPPSRSLPMCRRICCNELRLMEDQASDKTFHGFAKTRFKQPLREPIIRNPPSEGLVRGGVGTGHPVRVP